MLFTGLLCVLGVSAVVSRQYVFVNESLNWTEALTFCRQNHTDLASISSVKEMDQLSRPDTSSSTLAWIGLTVDSWTWSGTNSSSQYRNWRSGVPLSNPALQCVVSYPDGSWRNINCSHSVYFMCYTASVTKTYVLVKSTLPWGDAVSYCRQHYKDLALVESAAENQAMTSRIDPSSVVWIGLFSEGWSDGTLSSFTNWAPGRPQGSGPRCVAEDPSHLWTDLICDIRLPFYCYTGANNVTTTTAPTTTVRLVNGTACSGRVEVFYNGTWGTVCDDVWNINHAEVVCRQMGCGSALSAPCCAYFGPGSGQIWMDNVWCSGSELYLTNCGQNGFGIHDCGHHEDAGVVCDGVNTDTTITAPTTTGVNTDTTITAPITTVKPAPLKKSVMKIEFISDLDRSHKPGGHLETVRLVNGTACSGRVEVFYNGTWGTVCDDIWDISHAQVVCRQMGCGSALSAPCCAYFGPGSGQIWMDDVRCSGSELYLTNCGQNGFGIHNCGHHEDAGVVCDD